MNGFWAGAGVVQQLALAVGSAWNAAYFARQVRRSDRADRGRRVAASVLALLFAALAVEAVTGLGMTATALDVLRRMPLLLATLAIAYLVSYRGSHHALGWRAGWLGRLLRRDGGAR